MPKTFVRAFDGERLAQRRRAHGWTQRELAFAAGASWATLQKWERGAARPDPHAAARVAATLGCAVGDLVTLSESHILPGDVRAWSGHSITTAAAALGMGRARLAALEDGYQQPTAAERAALAALAHIEPEQFDRLWQRARAQLRERLGTLESEEH